MSVTILSGPIGTGKTSVAREILALLPAPVSYIEGDTFRSFIPKQHRRDRTEVFQVIMLALTAAAMPFACSGYEVLIDFSIPPQFLRTARKILKEGPLNHIALQPSLSVCEISPASRSEGRINNYTPHRDYYVLFEAPSMHVVSDDAADAGPVAKPISEGLSAGNFAVG
jgi:adenylylsulfate kinase-like enzyme